MTATTTNDGTPAKLDRPRKVSMLADLQPGLLIPDLEGTPKPIR